MVKKLRKAPTFALRCSDDEKNIIDAYSDATGQSRSKVFHELIRLAIPRMAAVIVRADIARDAAAPGSADWTPDLPNAKRDFELRNRKAQKEASK